MNSGTVAYDTHALDHESSLEGPFEIPIADLVSGDNVMAVEVHQVNSGSSDIVFGMSLEAAVCPSPIPAPVVLALPVSRLTRLWLIM